MLIVHAFARMDGKLYFDNVNDQIEPYRVETLASGHDFSDNSRESTYIEDLFLKRIISQKIT